MSPPSFLLCFLFFFLLSFTTFSSPLSTIAISHVRNTTIVCALLPSTSSYDLNCTAFPSGIIHSYPSSKGAYYSAITAGDGFLCALSSLSSSSSLSPNTSVMRWWDFTHQTSPDFDSKRVYIGPVLSKLSSSNSHVCGLRDDTGNVSCWRWHNISIPSGLKFKDIAVGGDFLCGLLDCGDVQCFGGEASRVVVGNFTQVAAGTRHACAISVYKELHCWGAGDPSNEQATQVLAKSVQAMALGDNRTCVLLSNGTVFCLGDGIKLPGDLVNQQFMSIEAKGNAFCGVLTSNFSLMCWGSPLFLTKHFVYPRALPAACKPISVSDCSCGFLPDYQTICLAGTTICQQCDQSLIVLPAPPSSPPPPPPTSVAPPSSQALPPKANATAMDHKAGGMKRTTIVLIIVGSVAIAISLAAIACYASYRLSNKSGRIHNSNVRPQRPRNQPRPELPTNERLTALLSKSHGSYIEEFSLQTLLAATNGFSRENKLGSGGYGTVYRATLSDGRTIAIKRAETRASTSTSLPPRQTKDKEFAFLSELALLSRVNHKNLVRLLGYCVERHERVLVYEFMPNGSLHDHLHKLAGSELSSWSMRLRVALDAARGIEYLHTYAVPPIIHRDIKSSNILLDDSWTAKVSDFGLSLMNLNDDSSPEESLHTAGTVGYMDPEYYRLQNLTAKSDVYSFGVVLLELLSGCKVIHRYEESSTPRNVVEFAVPHIVADDVHKVLDQKLPPPSPSEIEAVTYVGYLAADCVSLEGRYRPTMTEVVAALERAVTASTPPEPTLSRSSTTRSV